LPEGERRTTHRIGLISDAHGLLRPEVVAFLGGCDAIVHGGDIGDPAILCALSAIAPLTAVRGNNDRGDWALDVAETAQLRIGGLLIHVLHELPRFDPAGVPGVRVVVSGHSHKAVVDERGGLLYVNPGSAGPRRFRLPVTAGELRIDGDAVTARIVELL
jgi:putative phosphoesterase